MPTIPGINSGVDSTRINEARCRRLVQRAIDAFELDLSGRTVLTEAATGYYTLTPLIAALAGADHVYAVTRDSRFGSTQLVHERTMTMRIGATVYGEESKEWL